MARTLKKAKAVTFATVAEAVTDAEIRNGVETVDVVALLPAPEPEAGTVAEPEPVADTAGVEAEAVSAPEPATEAESGREIFIPLNKLKKSPRNARKTPHSAETIETYAASIAAMRNGNAESRRASAARTPCSRSQSAVRRAQRGRRRPSPSGEHTLICRCRRGTHGRLRTGCAVAGMGAMGVGRGGPSRPGCFRSCASSTRNLRRRSPSQRNSYLASRSIANTDIITPCTTIYSLPE